VAAVAAVPLVRESRASGSTRYDIPGTATVTGGLVALVYGFTLAAQHGWTSSDTLGFLAIATVLLVAFVVIEVRSTHPLLPMRIILERNRGGSYLAALMVGSGLLGMFLFLTFYFQGTLGYSALKAGFAFLPFSLGIIVAAGVASRVLPKAGPRPMMVGGFLAASLGLVWLSRITPDTSYLAHVLPAELLISLGMGTAFVPMSSTALYRVRPRDAGVASATLNTSQQIGGSLGTALLNTLAASATVTYLATRHHTPATVQAAQVHGYSVGFLVGACFLLVAALSSLFLVTATRADLADVDGVSGEVVTL